MAAIFTTFVLIVVGGAVRASGSGLACPDWPLCQGRVMPPPERGTAIEVAHRLLATTAGVFTLALALFAARLRRTAPAIFYGALAAGILLLAQILLGAAVIFARLPAALVTAHLGLAAAFAATLVLIAVAGYRGRIGPQHSLAAPNSTALLILGTAAATFGLLLVGAYVGSSGSSLACSQWPLCNDTLAPNGDWRVWINFAHRLLALATAALMALAVASAIKSAVAREVLIPLFGAALLTAVEIAVGALNPILRVPLAVAVTHLALAILIWLQLIAALAFAVGDIHRSKPTPSSA